MSFKTNNIYTQKRILKNKFLIYSKFYWKYADVTKHEEWVSKPTVEKNIKQVFNILKILLKTFRWKELVHWIYIWDREKGKVLGKQLLCLEGGV